MKKEKILYTCVFVKNENNVLLGYKKRGLLEGKWNGFGGKVEAGESILDAAFRELEEECGLKSSNMFENGLLTVEFVNQSIISEVYLFTTTKYVGTIVESNEMKPQWFDIKHIPLDDMCYDDRYWLPLLLEGKKFNAYFLYNAKGEVLKYNIDLHN